MSRTIYFPALKSDIKSVFKKKLAFIYNHWITFSLPVIGLLFTFNNSAAIFFLLLMGIISFLSQLYRFLTLKGAKEKGKALFFAKKKKERLQNLYLFLGGLLLAWISMEVFIGSLFFVAALHFLFKYILYIPSIVFLADDYELTISRRHKSKVFDFSYANRLRFVYNMIAFDHPINGKMTWKDINMNREKIAEIKGFLSNNFGKEMILNPTTGLPYVK